MKATISKPIRENSYSVEERKIYELKEKNRDLTINTLTNIIELIDELKYAENEDYDTIEKLIKQGLYLVKYNININTI